MYVFRIHNLNNPLKHDQYEQIYLSFKKKLSSSKLLYVLTYPLKVHPNINGFWQVHNYFKLSTHVP